MYILDTNVLTALHLGNPKIINAVQQLGNATIAITVITKVEMLRGRIEFLLKADQGDSLLRAQRLLLETEHQLDKIRIIPFDNNAIAQFEKLAAMPSMRKAGRADLLIASITLSQNATLVTRNVKDFQRFPQLKFVNWFDK